MKFREVGKIYETTDYGIFKKVTGNRDVNQKHVRKLVKSFKEIGYRNIPIVVDRDMRIIDGQHREEAAEILGLPVRFVIDVDASIEECIGLNISNSNWKMMNYIKSYADRGVEDYVFIQDMCRKYGYTSSTKTNYETGKIPASTILNLAVDCLHEGGGMMNMWASGNFKIGNKAELERRCVEFSDIWQAINSQIRTKPGRPGAWVSAYKYILKYNEINNVGEFVNIERLIDKLSTSNLRSANNTEEALDVMQTVYNYNLHSASRVYFSDNYKRYKDKKIIEKSTKIVG